MSLWYLQFDDTNLFDEMTKNLILVVFSLSLKLPNPVGEKILFGFHVNNEKIKLKEYLLSMGED